MNSLIAGKFELVKVAEGYEARLQIHRYIGYVGSAGRGKTVWQALMGLAIEVEAEAEKQLSVNPTPDHCLSRHEEKYAKVTLLKHPDGI